MEKYLSHFILHYHLKTLLCSVETHFNMVSLELGMVVPICNPNT
jgi:hypothetical protein